jgi:hypothetical protein
MNKNMHKNHWKDCNETIYNENHHIKNEWINKHLSELIIISDLILCIFIFGAIILESYIIIGINIIMAFAVYCIERNGMLSCVKK